MPLTHASTLPQHASTRRLTPSQADAASHSDTHIVVVSHRSSPTHAHAALHTQARNVSHRISRHNGHQRRVDVAARQAAPARPSDRPAQWTVQRVGELLESLRPRLGDKTDAYKAAFAKEDIDGAAMLKLTADELRELGLSLGHRKAVLEAVDQLRAGPAGTGRPAFSGTVMERAPPHAYSAAADGPAAAGQAFGHAGPSESLDESALLDRQARDSAPEVHRLAMGGGTAASRQMAQLYGGVHPCADFSPDEDDVPNADGELPPDDGPPMSLFKKRLQARRTAGPPH